MGKGAGQKFESSRGRTVTRVMEIGRESSMSDATSGDVRTTSMRETTLSFMWHKYHFYYATLLN